MKIKDVENKVGISIANIRYYEKEGLIHPERNETNNYRNYSQKDIEQLERIKVLRILGISIADIRELNEGSASLNDVLARRLELIKEEEKNLDAVRRVCETMRQQDIPYDAVDEQILNEEETSWSERLSVILKEDITKEILTPKQFHNTLALLLAWGYLLNTVISFIFGNQLLSYGNGACDPEKLSGPIGITEGAFPFAFAFNTIFIIPLILSIVCYVAIYFTSDIKAAVIIFHISALCLTPVCVVIYLFAETMIARPANMALSAINGTYLGIFWLLITAYVLILFVLSRMWNGFFSKARYCLMTALAYTAVMTILTGVICKLWGAPLISFLILTAYISLNWYHAYQSSEGGSRYYAVTEGCRIINLFGVVANMKGKTYRAYYR